MNNEKINISAGYQRYLRNGSGTVAPEQHINWKLIFHDVEEEIVQDQRLTSKQRNEELSTKCLVIMSCKLYRRNGKRSEDRLNKHQKSVEKQAELTLLNRHCRLYTYRMNWEEDTVLAVNEDCLQRKLVDACPKRTTEEANPNH